MEISSWDFFILQGIVDWRKSTICKLLASSFDSKKEKIALETYLLGMVALCKVEVQTILCFLNVNGILVSTGLQNQLFQVQERPLVGDLLANLDRSSPGVVCITLFAVIALLGCNHIFHLKCLLNDGALEGLLLNRNLHLDTAGVRFGPNEARIDNSDYQEENGLESFRFLKTTGPDMTYLC